MPEGKTAMVIRSRTVPSLKISKRSRNFMALILSSAMLIPVPVAANLTSTPTEAAPAYQLGYSLEGNYLAAYVAGMAKDTAAAAVYYREAMREDPQNVELMERAFVAFLANNDMAESFRLAERILKRNKDHVLARLALGVRDFHEHNFAAARTQFSPGTKQNTLDVSSVLLTAWAWAGEGNTTKALAAAAQLKGNRAFSVFRDYHSGLIAEVGKKPKEAEQFIKVAYEEDSNTLRIVEAYGRLLSQRGKKDMAVSVFETIEKLAPRQPLVRWALSELRAGKTLPPLIEKPNEGAAEVLYSLGAAGNVQGEELPAIIYLRLALYLDPQHPMAKISLADSYERIEQLDQSVTVLQSFPKSSYLYVDAAIQAAYALEQTDRGAEAQKNLEELATVQPKYAELQVALGNIERVQAAKEKDKDKSRELYLKAADSYSKALELMGSEGLGNWTILFYRGTAYERAKQWDKAEADLKKALSMIPDNQPQGRAQVMNYLAYSWVDTNSNIDEAFKLLQNAVELSPRDGMIIDSLGWAYYRLGRYEDAVRELERAIELKPGDPTLNDHLGDAYWKVGRKTEARFQWNHARDSNPEPEELEKILKKIENGLD